MSLKILLHKCKDAYRENQPEEPPTYRQITPVFRITEFQSMHPVMGETDWPLLADNRISTSISQEAYSERKSQIPVHCQSLELLYADSESCL